MKSVIVCAAIMVSLVGRGFAADDRPLPASPDEKASVAVNREQPPSAVLPAAEALLPASNLPLSAPTLPVAPSAIIRVKQRPETHRFLDVKNSFALSAVAVSLTADAISTQKGLSHPGFYEMNPLARPFVQSRAGAAVYSAGSLGLVAAGMYVAHRTNHHKLERIVPFAIAGWEGILSARNYHVIAANSR